MELTYAILTLSYFSVMLYRINLNFSKFKFLWPIIVELTYIPSA